MTLPPPRSIKQPPRNGLCLAAGGAPLGGRRPQATPFHSNEELTR